MSKAVIGVFRSEDRAKEAINELRSEGFDEREISMIVRDDEGGEGGEGGDKGEGFSMERQDLSEGVISGGALGGVAGILAGAGALLIPGVGPIVAAGPLAAFLTGVVGGGIVGGLVDYGIPEERGRHFESRVRQGDILVTLKVEEEKADEVTNLLERYGAEDVESH